MSVATSLMGSAATAVKNSRWPSRLVRHNPVAQRPLVRLADRYRSASGVERHAIRAEVLGRALGQAAATPYGRSLGLSDPSVLSAWPILDKSVLKADETRFHTGHRLPTAAAATGGTTGLPLQLRRSLFSLNAEQFFLDRQLSSVGLTFPANRHAVLRGDDIKDPSDTEPPFGQEAHGGHRLMLSSVHLNAASIGWYVEEIRRFAPDFLWVYPAALSSLVRLIRQGGLELSVPVVVTSSETLFPSEAAAAVEVLGATLIDYYGQAERVVLAAGEVGHGYRFDPLYGTAELVPLEADDPPEPGLAAASIIGTSHWNAAMPLVRYDTGDAIWYRPAADGDRAGQLDRIARGDEPFVGIKGRTSDYVIGPDGGILVGMNQLPRGLRDVVRMQVRQPSPTEIDILVVTATGEGLSDDDRATLDASIGRKLPPSMDVRVEVVDELPRTAAGKTPFVVRAPGLA